MKNYNPYITEGIWNVFEEFSQSACRRRHGGQSRAHGQHLRKFRHQDRNASFLRCLFILFWEYFSRRTHLSNSKLQEFISKCKGLLIHLIIIWKLCGTKWLKMWQEPHGGKFIITHSVRYKREGLSSRRAFWEVQMKAFYFSVASFCHAGLYTNGQLFRTASWVYQMHFLFSF